MLEVKLNSKAVLNYMLEKVSKTVKEMCLPEVTNICQGWCTETSGQVTVYTNNYENIEYYKSFWHQRENDKTYFKKELKGKKDFCVIEVEAPNHCSIISDNLEDELIKRNIAIILAREFSVTFFSYQYQPGKPEGSLKCRYCGQFTKNVEKCDVCGGAPI